MALTYDQALDRAMVALLLEAVEHSRALRHVLEQVGQLVAFRVQLHQSGAVPGPNGAPQGEQLPALTKREHEVMGYLVRGGSNREIAKAMGISERTVKNHMRNIFTKLGVADRTSAAVKALESRR
ncbi:LuxR family transcriptional regulator [Saccharopolyspora oryzae]|uniref:LuxR C-terminal-related transcriptional regulator n=1 Tax=Saccharopolyspora oryzae TaxID=2997343 RepID=A0ABT4UZU4_9PSEU|nr:LuxR family transcriptional regulator [Saccharopolyspora oryzae]MDA3626582.1 LuxR C-terminal-related transcriptional regulator [Saccharopolyspora oryzae]